jgi:glycosyltransferase involved in cell wall biosynthesis
MIEPESIHPVEVSVIIACYNDGNYLEQALDSVHAQTFKAFEIIVVDDGSEAATKKELERLSPKIDRLIFEAHFGVSSARNRALQEAKGEYVLILDADDYLGPELLEKALLNIQKEGVKFVSYHANRVWDGRILNVYKPKGGTIKDFLFNNEALGTSLYRKKDLFAAQGYDESMILGFEDWELHLRLLGHGGQAFVIEEPLYNYRKKPGSRNTTAISLKYQLLEYMVEKNKSLYPSDELVAHLFKKLQQQQAKMEVLTKFEKKILQIVRKFRGVD